MFKERIIWKLNSINRKDLTNELEECHQTLTHQQCKGCRSHRSFYNHCDKFYCPECQPGLSRDRRRQIEWWTKEIRQPKHVVLTVKNVLGTLTKQHVKEFKSWLAALRRRKFAANWRGGFYSLEVTNEGKGWHLHAHLLVDADYIDVHRLSEQWMASTRGFGRIVRVQDARDESYLKELTKYAVKGNQLAGWTPNQIAQFIDSFTGVRTFGVFGSLYGARTKFAEWLATVKDLGHKCPCGCSEFDYFTELEWLMLKEGIPLHTIRGP